jgi:hypothetical protein
MICAFIIAFSSVIYFTLHHKRKRLTAAAGDKAYVSP